MELEREYPAAGCLFADAEYPIFALIILCMDVSGPPGMAFAVDT